MTSVNDPDDLLRDTAAWLDAIVYESGESEAIPISETLSGTATDGPGAAISDPGDIDHVRPTGVRAASAKAPVRPGSIAPLVIGVDRDEQDRVWLEKRLHAFVAGMKAAYDAATEIAKNWTTGRGIGRLYPDHPDAASFLLDYLGPIRLPRDERDQFVRALVASGSSRRQAAKAAGVGLGTAARAASVPNGTGSPKPHNYGADLRAATNKLVSIVRAVRDEEWAPDTTEATLLTFLARALTEIGQAHGAEPKPGNVIDEVEAYLATEGRRP